MAQIKLMAGLQVFDLDMDIADASGKILGRKGDRIILMPQTLADAVQFMDGQSLSAKWVNLVSRFKGAGSVSVTMDNEGMIVISGTDTNTTYGSMTAATASAAGKTGLVPAPAAGAQAKYLRGDGTWQTPPNTTYAAATQSANGLMTAADKKKLDGIASGATNTAAPPAAATAAPKAHGTAAVGTSARYAREDHVHPSNNTDTHWTSHLYAGTSTGNANAATANGATYLIICDNSTARDRRLIKGAGSVSVTSDASGNITITGTDTNTTYGSMTAATASAAGKTGLVPAPAAGAQAKYLRGDGTWQTPPNTTYAAATQSANGLMTAADKKKLDGIAAGAQVNNTNVVAKTGARGALAGHETASALSNSQTITATSADCINLATSGAVTLTFTAAAATVRAVKSICLTASAATTLTVKNAVWANNGSAPVWGAAGKILVLLAHFVGGRVVLSVADNTQG